MAKYVYESNRNGYDTTERIEILDPETGEAAKSAAQGEEIELNKDQYALFNEHYVLTNVKTGESDDVDEKPAPSVPVGGAQVGSPAASTLDETGNTPRSKN